MEAGKCTPVVRHTEECTEELDLDYPYSDDEAIPYTGGRALLASLTLRLSSLDSRIMRNEDAISQLVSKCL